MHILFVARPNNYTVPGGDTVHMDGTIAAMREAGHRVVVQCTLEPEAWDYDVVNVIGLLSPYETALQVTHLRTHYDGPIFLTPWYWDVRQELYYSPAMTAELRRRADAADWALFKLSGYQEYEGKWSAYEILQQCALNCVGGVLAASYGERDALRRNYKTPHIVYSVVRTATDEPLDVGADEFVSKFGLRDFILCAGRVEPRKNQAALLFAARGLGIPVVLAGQANDAEYMQLCRDIMPDVVHVGQLDRRMMASAYQAARVHALPSWWEGAGIASMEARDAGLPVVVGDGGAEVEYMHNAAYYCAPNDVGQIRQALEAALQLPRREPSHGRTWFEVAEDTLNAFQAAP